MKMNALLLSLVAFGTLFTGCGLYKPCDLSNLKVRNIVIQGDKDRYLANAIKAELSSRGARTDPNGVDIIGAASLNANGIPISISVEMPTTSFAATGRTMRVLARADAAEDLGSQVAMVFCRCNTAGTQPQRH
jgi:hypothetical protein